MEGQIKALPSFTTIRLHFVVYPASARLTDIANVVSVHEKFFCDALTEFGKIPDDNFKHVVFTSSEYGEVDKENPRVDIHIFKEQ